MDVEEMYQEIILDHYRAKHFSGLRDPYEAEVHHVNPSCGDEVTLRVHLDGDTIGDVSYSGVGCSISQASTSVMAGLVRDKTVDQTLALHDEFLEMMQSQGNIEPNEDDLEDGIAFLGVAKFPARVKCALLGWSAFKDAVIRAQSEKALREKTTDEKVS
ncbi:SUF system NifU family Fe-S cluster assembly protein [Microlunatus elymi]|uniref:SUF system NifU family Fe-S cluster assembly protein n=1 Tax=Microlunatus elymi TaxID=2596828 RepID=A0A516Q626_9ACTN|nr:SUF system NifU family Fe-S cluster assembly protein [Microlunatus elymi]QDP98900.1 SUF system NifU family Fe-S cluster assembly protein [Microlunatus elymi]